MSPIPGPSPLSGARVLIMGLGAHGGGAATTRYCIDEGADVTVTDLRSDADLRESIELIGDLPVRFVLGRHDADDFRAADIVVKNPAVKRTVPLLREARRIETDISLFLSSYRGPVLAITGTKGKSTTASALHHMLLGVHPGARLGGNITVSPLSFRADLMGNEPVVLELSSFQLGDLALTPAGSAATSAFTLSAITNLMPDHQDYYGSMRDYAADKAVIFAGQSRDAWSLLSDDDEWSRDYRPPHEDRVIRVTRSPLQTGRTSLAGFADATGVLCVRDVDRPIPLVEPSTGCRGAHQRQNLLFAGIAAYLWGVPESIVRERASSFAGIRHRLELVRVVDGIRFINDSAATIAEAALAAVEAFGEPVHLIAGGSDKGVPLDAFVQIASGVESLHLLAGTATERIIGLLDARRIPYAGPYGSLETAFTAATAAARAGDIVMLSPGCASFGMFRNEFDRGDRFRRLVESFPGVVG